MLTSKTSYTYEYCVVVPIKNELGNLEKLVQEIHHCLSALHEPWQMLCIDDGSTDGSYEKLRELQGIYPELGLVKLQGNFGQSAAMKAGADLAKSRWVITIDADLQNDPHDIAKLCCLKNEADLICGWRKSRQDTWQKRWISKLSNWVRSRLCKDGIHDTGCSLKLMRVEGLRRIFWFRGCHRFLPALFKLYGFRVAEVPVHHRARFSGTSHYHLWNRGLAPIVDLLAFVWLRRRLLNYRVEKMDESK